MDIKRRMLRTKARASYEQWCKEQGICPYCGRKECECDKKEIIFCIACGHRLPDKDAECSCRTYGICPICGFPNDKCKCIEWGL